MAVYWHLRTRGVPLGSGARSRIPHRPVKKGPSRTFEQRPPHDLAQAYAERAAGAGPSGGVLRRGPRRKGRTQIGRDAPSRHYFIAETPPKTGPNRGNGPIVGTHALLPPTNDHPTHSDPSPACFRPSLCLVAPPPPVAGADIAGATCGAEYALTSKTHMCS